MEANARPVLLRVEGLRRDFPMGQAVVHALDGVDLIVEEGEFLGVTGPSGSGKSTLLHLLGGLDRPTAGHIWVRGRDLTALDENELAAYRRREVGFVFQSFYLIPTMTALQNVEFPMLFARVPRPSGGSGRSTCWSGSGWRTGGITGPWNSPAVSSNGSPSPARWRTTRC